MDGMRRPSETRGRGYFGERGALVGGDGEIKKHGYIRSRKPQTSNLAQAEAAEELKCEMRRKSFQ